MRVTILFLVYVALATDTVYGTCSNNVTVQISTGSYTGLIDAEFPNTRQFRVIPFAEPPIATMGTTAEALGVTQRASLGDAVSTILPTVCVGSRQSLQYKPDQRKPHIQWLPE